MESFENSQPNESESSESAMKNVLASMRAEKFQRDKRELLGRWKSVDHNGVVGMRMNRPMNFEREAAEAEATRTEIARLRESLGVAEHPAVSEDSAPEVEAQNVVPQPIENVAREDAPVAAKESAHDIPTDLRALHRYEMDNFGAYEKMPLTEFYERFSQAESARFRTFVGEMVRSMVAERIKNNTEGLYPDTVAAVFGDSGPAVGILLRMATIKEAKRIDMNALLKQPLSVIADRYFNINVTEFEPKYFQHFSQRPFTPF